MIHGISAQDPALQPAGAAARQVEEGAEATRKALDKVELQGRLAVQLIREAVTVVSPESAADAGKGTLVDRTA